MTPIYDELAREMGLAPGPASGLFSACPGWATLTYIDGLAQALWTIS